MKSILSIVLLLFVGSISFSQTKQYLRADSIYIQRDGGNGELILLNGTRDSTGGLLTNTGKGRTAFIKSRVVDDSTVVIGKDTLVVRGIGRPAPTDINFYQVNVSSYTDTTFSNPCLLTYGLNEAVVGYNTFNIPSFKNRRIRVYWAGWLITEDPCYRMWYNWNPTTGILKVFPGTNAPVGEWSGATISVTSY